MGVLLTIERYENKIKALEKSNDFQIRLKRKMKLKYKKAYEFQSDLIKKHLKQITNLNEAVRIDEKLMNRMANEHKDILSQMSEMAKENIRLLSELNR